MTIAIDFSPAEEARVTEAAGRAGMPPAELVKHLALEQLSATPVSVEERVRAKLREAQARDGHAFPQSHTLEELEAKWAAEDAALTDEEREANDKVWEEFERGINETRAELGMRILSDGNFFGHVSGE